MKGRERYKVPYQHFLFSISQDATDNLQEVPLTASFLGVYM